jgi:hypothetical protein
MKTESKIGQIILWRAYWDRLAGLLEWRVIGFSGNSSALYDTGHGHTLSIRAHERDAIVNRIEGN